MKLLIPLLAVLFCAGCAADAKDPSWTSVVIPYDQPPTECVTPPAPRPRLSLEPHGGLKSAQAYRKLAHSYDDLSADYRVCQIWAKGQR